MPRLSEQLKLKTITLPDSKAIVEIGMAYGDKIHLLQELNKYTDKEDMLEKELDIVLKLGVHSWDFTEDDGSTSPISADTAKKFTIDDGNFLKEELSKLLFPTEKTKEDKKK